MENPKVEYFKNNKISIRYILANDEIWYSLHDISESLGIRDLNRFMKVKIDKNLKYFNCNTPGGIQKHLFANKIILATLLKKYKHKSEIEDLCSLLRINLNANYEDIIKILNPILKSFEFEENYKCGEYIIDWYSKKYNIMLQYSPLTFKQFNGKYAAYRYLFIMEELKNPKDIHFDPNIEYFNILYLIEEICTIINMLKTKI